MAVPEETIEVICPQPLCRKRNRLQPTRLETALCGRCGTRLSGAVERMPGLWRLAHFPAELHGFYFWRTAREIAYSRLVAEPDGVRYFELIAVDVETGSQSAQRAFNERCASALTAVAVRVIYPPHETTHYSPPATAASPDGKWLAWHTGSQPHSIGSLDGQHLLTWAPDEDPEFDVHAASRPVWLRDSRRVAFLNSVYDERLETYRTSRAIIRSVAAESPAEVATFSNLSDGLIAGVDADDRVVMHLVSWERAGRAEFAFASLTGDPKVVQTLSIELPGLARVSGATVSPDGRRLAFVLEEHELIHDSHELWVCDLDGSEMRRVVVLPSFLRRGETWVTGIEEQRLRDPAWMPDGQWLSFLYGDALWALPVDVPAA